MPENQNTLQELLETLRIEKKRDFEDFKAHVQSLSLDERRKKGYTWYPLQVLKSGYTYGERAFVLVERSIKTESRHAFRSGMPVRFFTNLPGVKHPDTGAVINYVDKNKMKIILHSRDLPEWLQLGQLGIDLSFDERTYLEMEKALKKVMEAKGDRLAELRTIILGQQPAAFEKMVHKFQIPQLNPSQNKAVQHMLSAADIAVIHGPPGTGKTTTIVQAVKQLAKQEDTILVTAPSNIAVDLLTERMDREGLNVVRIGNISRVEEIIIKHTLDFLMANHPESKNIKKIKKQAAEVRRKARKYKRRFGHEERTERKALYLEAKELASWAKTMEERLIDQILHSAQVITATLVGAAHPVLEKLKFRTAIIDEAAQALEPASWIPITKASRIILAGDPFQLPPTVKSLEAKRKGLEITLIEKCLKNLQSTCLLNVQYRMHQKIMGFSNRTFYNNSLQADPKVAKQTILNSPPLLFIDTAGCGFEEQFNDTQKSRWNPDEFNVLREHLYQLIHQFNGAPVPEIAIISPYKEQVLYIKEIIREDEALNLQPIHVDTIDGFQGQEKSVVYISLVRSNSKGEIGFLKDYRRMNVAITRAKHKLVIVGDSATIGIDEFYKQLINYCEEEGLYQSAWEYMM